jgi:hypothetical protein
MHDGRWVPHQDAALLSRKMTIPKGPEVLTAGVLLCKFYFGWQLINDLQVGGWGVNYAHDGRSLDPRMLSYSLGLVEGNLYGVKQNLKEEMQCLLLGVLCDHETSCRMWAHSGRFVRFQMLCVVQSSRISGGYQSSLGIEKRELLEKTALPHSSHCSMIYWNAGFPKNIRERSPTSSVRESAIAAHQHATCSQRREFTQVQRPPRFHFGRAHCRLEKASTNEEASFVIEEAGGGCTPPQMMVSSGVTRLHVRD